MACNQCLRVGDSSNAATHVIKKKEGYCVDGCFYDYFHILLSEILNAIDSIKWVLICSCLSTKLPIVRKQKAAQILRIKISDPKNAA